MQTLNEQMRALKAENGALKAKFNEQSRCFHEHFAVMDALKVCICFRLSCAVILF